MVLIRFVITSQEPISLTPQLVLCPFEWSGISFIKHMKGQKIVIVHLDLTTSSEMTHDLHHDFAIYLVIPLDLLHKVNILHAHVFL